MEEILKKLTDTLNYLCENHSNLPEHVFEELGEVKDDIEKILVNKNRPEPKY